MLIWHKRNFRARNGINWQIYILCQLCITFFEEAITNEIQFTKLWKEIGSSSFLVIFGCGVVLVVFGTLQRFLGFMVKFWRSWEVDELFKCCQLLTHFIIFDHLIVKKSIHLPFVLCSTIIYEIHMHPTKTSKSK